LLHDAAATISFISTIASLISKLLVPLSAWQPIWRASYVGSVQSVRFRVHDEPASAQRCISHSLISILQIAEFCKLRGAGTESLASGLSKRLRPVGGHDIGSFPVVQEEPLTGS
jgi:hypothetical protein